MRKSLKSTPGRRPATAATAAAASAWSLDGWVLQRCVLLDESIRHLARFAGTKSHPSQPLAALPDWQRQEAIAVQNRTGEPGLLSPRGAYMNNLFRLLMQS